MPPSSQVPSVGADEVAVDVNFTPFFTVGALAVVIWDMLSEIREDAYLFNSNLLQRVGLKRTAYYLARLSVLAYLMTDAIYQIIPQPGTACGQIKNLQAALVVVSTAFTHLVVYFRMLSAFQYDRYTSWLFGLLWALVVAGSTTVIYGTSLVAPGSQITTCAALFTQRIEPFVAAAMLGPLLYLCLAYMFISGRLVVGVRMDLSMEHGMKELLMGMFVPIFGKGLLGEGQAFYLISIVVQLVAFIFFLSGGTPSTRFILFDSSIAITSIMACKVYRGTLKKEIKEVLDRKKVHQLALSMNMASQSTSTCNIGEIRVTKTVEQF